MINIVQDATPSATRIPMPAFPEVSRMGASVESRRIATGTSSAYGVFVPAFLKDAFSGVRAWSPPV